MFITHLQRSQHGKTNVRKQNVVKLATDFAGSLKGKLDMSMPDSYSGY